MADNVGYTPGVGASVAADEIGGVLYQRVKPVHGADGSATDTSSANPFPTVDAAAGTLLTSLLAKLLQSQTGMPLETDAYYPFLPVPSFSYRCGFDRAYVNGV